MATGNKTNAKVFNFLNEEILAGRGDVILPGSEALSGVIKRYAEGGENNMHCHPTEDHVFYTLDGQATFHIGSDDNVAVVNKHEAVFLPKGTYYRFQSSGDVKLVMLRVGSEQGCDRLDAEGNLVLSRRAGIAPRVEPRNLPF